MFSLLGSSRGPRLCLFVALSLPCGALFGSLFGNGTLRLWARREVSFLPSTTRRVEMRHPGPPNMRLIFFSLLSFQFCTFQSQSGMPLSSDTHRRSAQRTRWVYTAAVQPRFLYECSPSCRTKKVSDSAAAASPSSSWLQLGFVSANNLPSEAVHRTRSQDSRQGHPHLDLPGATDSTTRGHAWSSN